MGRRTENMTDTVITKALAALPQMLITTGADTKIPKKIAKRTLRRIQRKIHARNQRRITRRIRRKIITITGQREARARKAKLMQ
jgi:hypothetical protein